MRYFLLLPVVAFLLFQVGTCSMKRHTAQIYAASVKGAPFDAVIVPGIPFDSAAPNYMLKVRMHWARHLFQSGITRHIIFSGATVHTPYIEGYCMKAIADSMGIPPQYTFSETNAQHGTENISLGRQLADSLGFKNIAVATDPFQSFYLLHMADNPMPDIPFLPLSIDSMSAFNRPLPHINAEHYRVKDFVPLDKR